MTAKDMHNDAHNRLLSDDDLGALASYDNGSYVCECPGDYCLMGDCLGKVETLTTVVEGIVRTHIASELIRQADHIAERIRMHGLGLHSDTQRPCLRCEAWGQDEATLRARVREMGRQG